MPGSGVEAVRARGLAVVLVLLLVTGFVVSVASVPAPARAAGIDPRVPGPDNPVGPTDWNALIDQPNRAFFNSGGSVTLTDVRFLDGFEVTNGTSVTIRNCQVISPGSFWTILVRSGSLLMEDCQIGDYTTLPGERGVGGDNVTLRRVKIVGHTDGIKAGEGSLYEQVWVTDLRDAGPGHEDAMQDEGSGDYIVRYSRLEAIKYPNGANGNAAAIIKSDLGSINNVTFENNVLDGGQYVLMVANGTNYPAPKNVVIRDNAFGRNAVYGVLLVNGNPGITWENNFWEDTGEYIDEDGDPIGGGVGATTTTQPGTTTTTQPGTTTTTQPGAPPITPGGTPTDAAGLVDPTQGRWYLRHPDGSAQTDFLYGNPGDVPFLGDWNCDGIDTPGLFRQSDAFVYLRNTNSQGVADIRFFFGNPSDVPLAGDFNGDGCDTLSLYRPSEQRFYIMNELGQNEGGVGAAEFSFIFGNAGDQPVVGDWDGDGIDEIGLHRESSGFFYWRNTLTQGVADGTIFFGDPQDRLIAGDWGRVDGIDSPAVFRPSDTAFYFRYTLTQGPADSQVTWGQPGWLPIAGLTEP